MNTATSRTTRSSSRRTASSQSSSSSSTPRKNSSSSSSSINVVANMLKTPNKRFREQVKRKKLAPDNTTNIMSGKYGSVIILSKALNNESKLNDSSLSSGGERTPTPRTPLKNIDPNILFSPSNNYSTIGGDGGSGAPFLSPSFKTPTIAVKSQQIVKKQENCTPIREFKIQKELTKMRVGKLNLFPNVFSSFSSTTCPEDDLSNDDDQSSGSSDSERSSPKKKKKKKSEHYFNIIMEKCDGGIVDLIQEHSLSNGKVSIVFAKQIAFQLLFALSIAESIGFQHNDMHERNVLYKKLPKTNNSNEKKGIAFIEKIDSSEHVWLLDCNFILKVADYGLSRIQKEDGEEIESGNVFHSGAFNSDLDRVKEILTKRIKLESASSKEDAKLFANLKKSIKSQSGVSAKSLLLHEFFDSLRAAAEDDNDEGSGGKSGDENIYKDYHIYYGAKHEKRC